MPLATRRCAWTEARSAKKHSTEHAARFSYICTAAGPNTSSLNHVFWHIFGPFFYIHLYMYPVLNDVAFVFFVPFFLYPPLFFLYFYFLLLSCVRFLKSYISSFAPPFLLIPLLPQRSLLPRWSSGVVFLPDELSSGGGGGLALVGEETKRHRGPRA